MRRILPTAVLLVLQGCVAITTPDRDVEYQSIRDLNAVTGCYRNLGERQDASYKRYLSQILWPVAGLQHDQIQLIDISLNSENAVLAQAITNGVAIKESRFESGRDFELEAGRVRLKSRLHGSFAYPAGNPFIGLGYESVTLDIDQSDHGKLTESNTLGGTAFLFIPIAAHVSENIRFVRTGQSCMDR